MGGVECVIVNYYLLSFRLEQFKSTFNAEISQFISSVRVMERTKADATRYGMLCMAHW